MNDELHAFLARRRGITVEAMRAVINEAAERNMQRARDGELTDLDACDTCQAYRGFVRPYSCPCPECGATR